MVVTLQDMTPGARGDGQEERHHRLDGEGERKGGDEERGAAVLRKYGYPPDKQEKAIETVIEQAELLSEEWANA